MKRFVLPCETQDRELDAKLLISAFILNKDPAVEIIIGFDKNINQLLKDFSLPAVLLDKSCSNIMYQARIRRILSNNGRVAIGDEEGINNIPNNFDAFLARYDPRAVDSINSFLAWGELDMKLALKANIKNEKISIVGNSRFDLLSERGRKYFHDDVHAIQHIFDPYFLVSDNFAVEHYNEDYKPPLRSHLTNEQALSLKEIRESKRNFAKIHRDKLTKIILKLSNYYSGHNFIIRPHPISDPKYWNHHFGKSRNVFVIYKGPVEPWILGAQGLFSAGCTTALQAAIAKIPVFHVSPPYRAKKEPLSSGLGVAINDSNKVPLYNEERILHSYQLVSQWVSNDPYASERIASQLLEEARFLPASDSILDNELLTWRKTIKQSKPYEPKWRESGLSINIISDKIKKLFSIFDLPNKPIKIHKVLNSVFLISNAN